MIDGNGVLCRASRAQRGLRNGFTLIELLVVIAIIGLLVSILLPSLGRAMDMAEKVSCSSNMRHLAQAGNTYANDYRGFWPMADNDSNIDDESNGVRPLRGPSSWKHYHLSWIVALDPYLGLPAKTPEDFAGNPYWKVVDVNPIKQCAVWTSYPDQHKGYSNNGEGEPQWSIGMNGFFHRGDSFNGIPNPGYSFGHSQPWKLKIARQTEMHRPHITVAFADKIAYDVHTKLADQGGTLPYVEPSTVAPRHLGAANVGFVDGHAESLEQETYTYKSIRRDVEYEAWYPEIGVKHDAYGHLAEDLEKFRGEPLFDQQKLIWNFNLPHYQRD